MRATYETVHDAFSFVYNQTMMSRQRRESLLYQHRQHHISHQPCLRSENHRPSMRLSLLQKSLRYFQWDRAPIGPMIANRSLREHCVVRSQVSRASFALTGCVSPRMRREKGLGISVLERMTQRTQRPAHSFRDAVSEQHRNRC